MPQPDPWNEVLERHFSDPLSVRVSRLVEYFAGTSVEVHWDAEDGFLRLDLPSGLEASRSILLFDAADMDNAYLERERLTSAWFIEGYQALWIRGEDVLEAALRPATRGPLGPLRRVLGSDSPAVVASRGGARLVFGPTSSTLRALTHSTSTSLRLEGFQLRDVSHAVEVLEKVANAFLFDVAVRTGVHLTLAPSRQSVRRRRTSRLRHALSFPENHYDLGALSLYTAAKAAQDMPHLEFLSFYQVIEFYFPRYTQEASVKAIATIVKDPAFSPHRTEQIMRVVTALSSRRAPRAGDERSQLRTTLLACVDHDEFIAFLSARSYLVDHLRLKNPKLSEINPRVGTSDFLERLSDRIYEIRCRIVHSKDNTVDQAMIVPHSAEARLIASDSEILEYLAQRVLIHSSQSLEV